MSNQGERNATGMGRQWRALLVLLSWVAMLSASSFPYIVWRAFLGHNDVSIWIPVAQLIAFSVSLTPTFILPSLQSVRGFILALAAMAVGDWIRYGIENANAWTVWAQTAAQYQLISADSFVALIPGLLMALTLIGSGIGRRELFLVKGSLSAPAKTPFGLPSIPWTVLGPALTILFTLPLVLQLISTVHPDFALREKVVGALPIILTFSIVNAASEEFRFRSVLIARMEKVLGPRHALLLTSALFGLGHWFGHPSGPTGVVMAGVAGWFWGKAMIETRGFFWSWFIHGIQDLVILTFIIMTAT